MGTSAGCLNPAADTDSIAHCAVPALWRADLVWSAPAGMTDYTPCLQRIEAALRPDRKRAAAGEGSATDALLRGALTTLELDREGGLLDIATAARILTAPDESARLEALIALSRLGLIDFGVSFGRLPRIRSIFCRRLNLPLSPGRPTLAHVLAHAGRVGHEVSSTNLRTRFLALKNGGLDLDARSLHGRTPLHLAVLARNAAAVDALLSLGADIEAIDRCNHSALMLATRAGFDYAITALVSAGAKAATDESLHHHTPSVAAWSEPGRFATEVPASPERNSAREDEMSPLMYAAASGHANTLLTLAQEGADLNLHSGRLLRTALHIAAQADQPHAIEALVSAGADVNAQDATGATPLHLAAWLGKIRATRELIRCGADFTRTDRLGRTAVDLAREAGRTFTFEALTMADANTRREPNDFRVSVGED